MNQLVKHSNEIKGLSEFLVEKFKNPYIDMEKGSELKSGLEPEVKGNQSIIELYNFGLDDLQSNLDAISVHIQELSRINGFIE